MRLIIMLLRKSQVCIFVIACYYYSNQAEYLRICIVIAQEVPVSQSKMSRRYTLDVYNHINKHKPTKHKYSRLGTLSRLVLIDLSSERIPAVKFTHYG